MSAQAEMFPAAPRGYYNSVNPRDDWATPADLIAAILAEFSVDLDVCADARNSKCREHFDAAADGLARSWAGRVCWMNPPYGKRGKLVELWTAKARSEAAAGATVVSILPAKTETKWWHRDVLGCRGKKAADCRAGSCKWAEPLAEVRPIRGRVCFLSPDGRAGPAPFPTAFVIWRPPKTGRIG